MCACTTFCCGLITWKSRHQVLKSATEQACIKQVCVEEQFLNRSLTTLYENIKIWLQCASGQLICGSLSPLCILWLHTFFLFLFSSLLPLLRDRWGKMAGSLPSHMWREGPFTCVRDEATSHLLMSHPPFVLERPPVFSSNFRGTGWGTAGGRNFIYCRQSFWSKPCLLL